MVGQVYFDQSVWDPELEFELQEFEQESELEGPELEFELEESGPDSELWNPEPDLVPLDPVLDLQDLELHLHSDFVNLG